MLTRPRKNEAEAKRKLWGRGRGQIQWDQGQRYFISYKNTVYELQHEIYQYQELTPNMTARPVSMHYSTTNFNRILWSKQQFPIREERNVYNVISMTDNEATRTRLDATRPRPKILASMTTSHPCKLRTTKKQHKIQQNKTTPVQSPVTTLGQETRWAYSTTLSSPHWAPRPEYGGQENCWTNYDIRGSIKKFTTWPSSVQNEIKIVFASYSSKAQNTTCAIWLLGCAFQHMNKVSVRWCREC